MANYLVQLVKFYILVLIHGLKYIGLHYFSQFFTIKKYSNADRICIPPPCLSDESLGQHQYAKLQNCKFHYVEKGDRNNKLVLLIHGFPEFWYSWRYQLKKLSEYYWVVAIDLKGFGDSDKPSSSREYDINSLVKELRGFLAALDKDQCTLISHGYGGLLAWHFVNKYPDCVDSHVAIASPHPLAFLAELDMNRVPRAGWHYFCMMPHYPFLDVTKQNLQIFDNAFSRLISNKHKNNFSPQDMDAYKYTFSRRDDWVGPINHIRCLMKEKLRTSPFKRKVSVPTLFIIGNADPVMNLEMICKSSEFIDNFTLKIVEGGGHYLPQEMPNYVNSLILNFLKLPEAQIPALNVANDGSLIQKMFGAGKNVVYNYSNQVNQVWSSSVDAVSRGVSIPRKMPGPQQILLNYKIS